MKIESGRKYICTRCGKKAEIAHGSVLCKKCFMELGYVACSKCDWALDESWKYCPYCGMKKQKQTRTKPKEGLETG